MTEIQKAAFIQSQAACAVVEALGMMAANQARLVDASAVDGLRLAYDKDDFEALIYKYGIHHNAVLTYMQT